MDAGTESSAWSWAALVLKALVYTSLVLAVALLGVVSAPSAIRTHTDLVWYLSCRYYLLERWPLAQELLGVKARPPYTPSRRYRARVSARSRDVLHTS